MNVFALRQSPSSMWLAAALLTVALTGGVLAVASVVDDDSPARTAPVATEQPAIDPLDDPLVARYGQPAPSIEDDPLMVRYGHPRPSSEDDPVVVRYGRRP